MKDIEAQKIKEFPWNARGFFGLWAIAKLLVTGASRTLEESDLFSMPAEFQTETILKETRHDYDQVKMGRLSLRSLITRHYGSKM
jgi:hypothetical protein